MRPLRLRLRPALAVLRPALAALVLAPLPGCLATLPGAAPAEVSPSTFAPDAFFAGRTRGAASLAIRGALAPEVLRVESTGRVEPNGTFRLDQTIQRENQPRTTRTWFMARTAGGGYGGTLTEARGPVALRVDGPRLYIRYRMAGFGQRMEQTLTLLPGDTVAHNVATVRFLGLPVARLSERIARLDGPMHTD